MGYILNEAQLLRKLKEAELEELLALLVQGGLVDTLEVKTQNLEGDRYLLYSARKFYRMDHEWRIKMVDSQTLHIVPIRGQGKRTWGLAGAGSGFNPFGSSSPSLTQVGETSFLTPEEREQVKEAARIIRMERGEEVPENG